MSAICVQRFDDSLNSAIRITYRISLRSSSLREPRYPSTRVVWSQVLSETPSGSIRTRFKARHRWDRRGRLGGAHARAFEKAQSGTGCERRQRRDASSSACAPINPRPRSQRADRGHRLGRATKDTRPKGDAGRRASRTTRRARDARRHPHVRTSAGWKDR